MSAERFVESLEHECAKLAWKNNSPNYTRFYDLGRELAEVEDQQILRQVRGEPVLECGELTRRMMEDVVSAIAR